MPIKHDFVSQVSDVGIPEGWVKPGNWNAEHVLLGLLGALDTLAVQPSTIPAIGADGLARTIVYSTFMAGLMASASAGALLLGAGAAPLDSPAFTGTPTAPNQTAGNNSQRIANTAYVDSAIAALLASAPAALDTLNELAAALGNDPNFATTVTNAIALKAPINSPGLTGTPTAPTVAGTTDNTTKIATTAFVQAVAALLAPLASPALTGNPTAPTQAANNNSTRLATTAYVDTADALKAPLASPTFTGDPKAPTPTAGDNDTSIATTAFVQAALAAAAGLVSYFPPQGRLTVTSGVPVLTAATTGNTSVYYTPYAGDLVPLYNGTGITPTVFTEMSQALSDTTKSPAAAVASTNYDLFVWSDAGTIRCTRGPAWTSSTARGSGAGTTELVRVKGLLLNANAITNGPAAQRGTYVGTVRTRAADATIDWNPGGSASGGTAAQLMVWNAYNRVNVSAVVTDTGSSYTYSGSAIRQARASTGNQVNMVIGLAEESQAVSYMARGTVAALTGAAMGWTIGLDSTTAASWANTVTSSVGAAFAYGAPNTGAVILGIGYHFVAALEFSDGTNSSTFNASGNNALALTTRM